MAERNQIKSFKECISFFEIPNLPYEALSWAEKQLYNICREFFVVGNLDFDNIDTTGLDQKNKRKVAELVSQILDSFQSV